MQSARSAACPSAPVHQRWCQVMPSWTVSACTLTGVNIAYKRQQEGGRGKVCFKYDCAGMLLPCRPLTPQREVLDIHPEEARESLEHE